MTPAEVLAAIGLATTLAETLIGTAKRLNANGEITDEQLAEVKGRYDAVNKSWDDRVAEAKLRQAGDADG